MSRRLSVLLTPVIILVLACSGSGPKPEAPGNAEPQGTAKPRPEPVVTSPSEPVPTDDQLQAQIRSLEDQVQALSPPGLKGTVRSLIRGNGILNVQFKGDRRATLLSIEPSTRITRDGKSATIKDLDVGQQVVLVLGSSRTSKVLVSIEIRSPESLVQERRAAGELESEIQKLRRVLEEREARRQAIARAERDVREKILFGNPSIGDRSRFAGMALKVIQVIDAEHMLASPAQAGRNPPVYYLAGFSTAGMADGSIYRFTAQFRVAGTTSYPSLLGQRTVFRIEYVGD